MKPLWGVVLVVAIAAPWFCLVGLRTDGEFLRRFFLTENLGRASTAFENHRGGLWYYPVAIAIGFFPWSLFLATMLLGAVRLRQTAPADSIPVRLLGCWIVVQVGLFSLAATKLPSYVTPCFPALAIACGWTLDQLVQGRLRVPTWWRMGLPLSLGIVGIGAAAGLATVCVLALPGVYWPIGLGLLWLAVAVSGWTLLRRGDWNRWVLQFQWSSLAFAVGLFGFAANAISQSQQTDDLLAVARARAQPMATFRCLESSWVYYAGQPIRELATDAAQEERSTGSRHFWEPKPRWEPGEFVRRNPEASILTTDRGWVELQTLLPPQFQVVHRVPFFLRSGELLLIAPVAEQVAEADMESDVAR